MKVTRSEVVNEVMNTKHVEVKTKTNILFPEITCEHIFVQLTDVTQDQYLDALIMLKK